MGAIIGFLFMIAAVLAGLFIAPRLGLA